MRKGILGTALLAVAFSVLYFTNGFQVSSAKNESLEQAKGREEKAVSKQVNPVGYFEIPVTDVDRAIKFYEAVFGFDFTRESIDGNEMALFPLIENAPGITGALAKGEIYKPTKEGTLIYFSTENIDETLEKAKAAGGKVLYPKTSIGDLGFVAEFQDSEGNRIALHSKNK